MLRSEGNENGGGEKTKIGRIAVSIKYGLGTTDCGLGIKYGLGIKRGLENTDWV